MIALVVTEATQFARDAISLASGPTTPDATPASILRDLGTAAGVILTSVGVAVAGATLAAALILAYTRTRGRP